MEKPLTNEEKEQIRRLRALKNPDGSHVHTLDALGERFGVSHQRISQIVNPDPGKARSLRYRATEQGRANQAKHNKRRTMVGLGMVYMQHYRKHRLKGVKDPDCHFCQRSRV